MKITELKYTKRTNLGNYEHAELSATAILEDNEDAAHTFNTLKSYVDLALLGQLVKQEKKEVEYTEPTKEEIEAAPHIKKEKKSKAKKEKPEVQEVVAQPTIEEVKEEPKLKNTVIYNSNIQEHKSIFAGYLAEKYGNDWKTVADASKIKEFTTSLNGKYFLDDNGKILSSFLSEVHGFFGA